LLPGFLCYGWGDGSRNKNGPIYEPYCPFHNSPVLLKRSAILETEWTLRRMPPLLRFTNKAKIAF
jgi:hypothetical protein